MLDKLREDILEDKKKAAILKTLKQLSSKDYLIAIVDSEHAKFQDVVRSASHVLCTFEVAL
eukprot:4415413-Prorocentrum_lima.AAC.1